MHRRVNAKTHLMSKYDALFNERLEALEAKAGGGSGSGGGIPTAIIKQDGYDNALMGVAVAGASAPTSTYTCTNMTYEEAKNIILSGQPLNVVAMMFQQNGSYTGFATGYYLSVVFSILEDGSEAIVANSYTGENIIWTSDGITVEEGK